MDGAALFKPITDFHVGLDLVSSRFGLR